MSFNKSSDTITHKTVCGSCGKPLAGDSNICTECSMIIFTSQDEFKANANKIYVSPKRTNCKVKSSDDSRKHAVIKTCSCILWFGFSFGAYLVFDSLDVKWDSKYDAFSFGRIIWSGILGLIIMAGIGSTIAGCILANNHYK